MMTTIFKYKILNKRYKNIKTKLKLKKIEQKLLIKNLKLKIFKL